MKVLRSFISYGLAWTAANCISLGAQMSIPAHQSDSMNVTITMEKAQVEVGHSPKVLVTMKNVSGRPLHVIHCPTIKVYVQGENGEPPTTRLERDFTNRLLPGEAPLACNDMAAETIDLDDTHKSSVELSYYYDLSQPAKYTVYLEFPSQEENHGFVWLRTKPVQFEIVKPAQP